MNDGIRESLSAMMDGEADELELRRVLRSDGVRDEWAALHRNQQLMHDAELPFPKLDISARVMAAIDAEPELGKRRLAPWRQALSGFAVAASVAAVVVFAGSERMLGGGVNMVAGASDAAVTSGRVYPAQMSPAARGGVAVSAAAGAAPNMSPAVKSEADKRFEMLLRKHTERASLNNGQGVVSYARVVSQESK